MKRFLLKCMALFLIVSTILWMGGIVYRQTTTYRNLEITEETEKYHALPERVTFAAFGASHGRDAFQMADYGEGFFNFSLSSQTPQYDWMQLRQFEDRIAPGATVVLTVSYISPFWTETEKSFENKQERYYRILSMRNIVNCDVEHWILKRWSPLLTTDCSDVLSAFISPPKLKATENERRGKQCLQKEQVEQEQKRIGKDHLSTIEPAMPNGNPVMLNAYHEIAALCRENGWNAVLVTPPYLQVYTDCFSEEILERFRTLTKEISTETGMPWLDYSEHEEFVERYDYYKNIDHLNLAGASAFAEYIQEDLIQLGLSVDNR